MAKKSKERNEAEYLKAENRKLAKENKSLKKQLTRSNKRATQYEDLEEKIKDIEIEKDFNVVPESTTCVQCKGPIKESDLGIRIIKTCITCGHREVIKRGKAKAKN